MEKFLCVVCGRHEDQCGCERVCILCSSVYNVRLCEDGQYYCADCRAVCDFAAQD